MPSTLELLHQLQWWKLRVELLSTYDHTRSWLAIFQGIIKAVTLKAAEEYSIEEFKTHTPIFHLIDKRFNLKIPDGARLNLEIIFDHLEEKALHLWRQTFIEYLNESEFSKRFVIREIPDIEKMDISRLLTRHNKLPQEGELCLEFMTPLPFTPQKGKDRCYLTKEQFIKLLLERLRKLSGKEISYEGEDDDWYLLPCYWHYSEIRHQSLSQPGRVKYINGCTGNLYIKGRWKNLLPLLLIGEDIHIGTKLTYSRGYYRLHPESLSFFSPFPDRKLITSIIIEKLHKSDSIENTQIDEEKLSSEIAQGLKDRTYTPSPPVAFAVKEGFIVERYELKDIVVQQYLLHLLERPINMSLPDSVIGYKKGVSFEKTSEIIANAIKDGYEYIGLFDLKTYYQSIRQDILIERLDRLLPQKDRFLLELLERILKTGYILSNTYYDRGDGLPRSSPLSPILGSFYLHPVDEGLNTEDTICIRYADKFLLLAKTPEALQEAIKKAGELLERLNLKIDPASLIQRHYTDGFKFCGITFDGENLRNSTVYKKPLYITEPDTFIGINGEAIEVRKKGELMSSIPLHRISEIIISSRASLSTAMLELAVKNEVPVSIQLNSGYNITTIKPDTKRYYELSFLHTRLYSELTEQQILDIAKLIVTSKLKSYIELFIKKYETKDVAIAGYLERIIKKLQTVENLNELRAYEGLAAKNSLRELNNFIKNKDFSIKARIRRPADRTNSLLNFGYYLLFSRLNATVRAVGLNPYLGFLHEPSNRYESLVADLQELFRARVDNFILKLINLSIFAEKDFIETKKGFRLNPQGIKKFIHHFETEMDRKWASEDMTFEGTLYDQVLQIKRWVFEEDELFFYVVMP